MDGDVGEKEWRALAQMTKDDEEEGWHLSISVSLHLSADDDDVEVPKPVYHHAAMGEDEASQDKPAKLTIVIQSLDPGSSRPVSSAVVAGQSLVAFTLYPPSMAVRHLFEEMVAVVFVLVFVLVFVSLRCAQASLL
ncbi:hypothetical protein CTRI78_v003860 [Colletotrichum trifolii]|uniref:Uncharacterized protein n=1 Tax=Colletotrichum trifolii TaxID=5466 RepID=A0A4R8RIH6_COLTR|nr:hypothetical protein CTRI78_v003860 [Colletotrichum trifolii]